MSKRWKRQKKTGSSYEVIALAALIGVLLLTAVFWISTRNERIKGERVITDTLELMKQQCIRYDNLTASEETKEQIQLLDKARELSRCLETLPMEEYDDFLKSYADNQRITGIMLLDSDGNVVKNICSGRRSDEPDDADWITVLQDKNISDVMQFPKKTYISRLQYPDGRIWDYAAVGRPNGQGILFCYIRQIQSLSNDNQIRLETIFSGYHLEMDGLILITDGDVILSSNEEELRGQATSDFPLIAAHDNEISSGGIRTIQQDGIRYIAGFNKCRSYDLYTFLPVREVFRQRSVILAYALILYIFFLLLIVAIKQNEVKRTNQLKMKFLRQMCHDIRTPLNGIRGMVQIGDSYPDDMEKQKDCRDKIWKASGLLMDLINDVLDMGKLESGEITLEAKPFQLQELIHDIVSVMENQAKDQEVSLVIDTMEGRHWDLIGSPVHLRRMMTNMLSNAIKYNKKGGFVRISCYEQEPVNANGRTVFEFVCADTGIGMTKEFQKRMFDQFTQETNTGEVAHHGTGLGLAIVKNLVQEMKGSIRCESERDKGTTFYITIPFVIDPKKRSDNAAANGCTQVQLKDVSVLLVEDNELNMEVAEFILEEEGMRVTRAWNGQEAVRIFEESAPGDFQIILMDMMMPVMDGESAVRTIRQLPRDDARTIPIIAMTANAFEEDIRSALACGMNAHIAKPISPEHLIAEIGHHL